jgi:F0F1-type ATP synthase delta subunit
VARSTTEGEPRELKLPVMVAGPADVGRLLRELELIDQTLLQLSLRKGGDEVKMPKTSRLMDQILESNRLNLLHKLDRAELEHFLTGVKKKSPVMHMSFSADPSPVFIEKLMTWLRREIHPQVLLTIGLQPTLGAGTIVRTTNKQFDFSLREDFLNQRELLLKSIAQPGAVPVVAMPAASAEEPS